MKETLYQLRACAKIMPGNYEIRAFCRRNDGESIVDSWMMYDLMGIFTNRTLRFKQNQNGALIEFETPDATVKYIFDNELTLTEVLEGLIQQVVEKKRLIAS